MLEMNLKAVFLQTQVCTYIFKKIKISYIFLTAIKFKEPLLLVISSKQYQIRYNFHTLKYGTGYSNPPPSSTKSNKKKKKKRRKDEIKFLPSEAGKIFPLCFSVEFFQWLFLAFRLLCRFS